MSMAIISVIVSFVIGVTGAVIAFENNMPGLGPILAVVVMGGFIMFELRRKK